MTGGRYDCFITPVTTNIFKEHIRTFTSQRTSGRSSCKAGLALIAASAAAARLTMISGNFVLPQHFGKY